MSYRLPFAFGDTARLPSEIERKIRQIHVQETWMRVHMCAECKRKWPCPTIKTLDGEAQPQHESEVG